MKYKDPYRSRLGPLWDNKDTYLICDKIKLLLEQNPVPTLTEEEQRSILEIALNSVDLVEYNSYQAMISALIMNNDNIDVIYSEVMNLMSILSWRYGGYVDVDESKSYAYKRPSSFCRYGQVKPYVSHMSFSYGLILKSCLL